MLELWNGRRLVHRAKVAVGAPGMETPLGLYYVTFRFRPIKQPFLGTFAFATSAYSKLSDWPGGGIVGLHGTYQPWLLGQAASHGCVRMSNATANCCATTCRSARRSASWPGGSRPLAVSISGRARATADRRDDQADRQDGQPGELVDDVVLAQVHECERLRARSPDQPMRATGGARA